VIVRLPLPKLLSGAPERPVGFSRRRAFQRFQQEIGRNRGKQKNVDVIRHDDERSETIVVQRLSAKQRFDHEHRNRFLPQKSRANTRGVQITIDSGEGFAIGARAIGARAIVVDLAGGRKMGSWQAVVEGPGQEKPAVIGIEVGKTAFGPHELNSAVVGLKFSRSHECGAKACERGTQECVRHRDQA